MSTPSSLMAAMIAAAQAAGASLAKDFATISTLEIVRKGPADFVSQADVRAEEILKDRLAAEFPGYGFLGEEGGQTAGGEGLHDTNWIVDPLDGTTNFLCGSPLFAVNLALEREGRLHAAVTHNPVLNETYWAEAGSGAWLNGKPIRVSSRPRLSDAVLAVGIPFPGKPDIGLFAREVEVFIDRSAGLRRLGSAAMDMAYVAAGRADAYWERCLNAWDVAAGAMLISEAGGVVTAADGSPFDVRQGSVCACNPHIQQELLAGLAQARRAYEGRAD